MLNAYNLIPQDVIVDGLINFEINSVRTGNSTYHRADSSIINLCEPGYYLINFNAIGVPTEDGDVSVKVVLIDNGEEVPGALSSSSSIKPSSLSFSTIIQVKPCRCYEEGSARLAFRNVGDPATFETVNVSVVKLY